MISLQQALAHYAAIAPINRVRSVTLEHANGHTLARNIRSTISLPPMRQSAMDGYALRHNDLATASPQQPVSLPVTISVAAGSVPPALKQGEAARIFTGAPIPAGADCVEIQENVSASGDAVCFSRQPAIGANIRNQGEELSAGQVVLAQGQRLEAQSLSIAANAGHAYLPCLEKPRVAIIVTGDELVAPGSSRGPADIFESNGSFLQHFAHQQHCELHSVQRIGDDVTQLTQAVGEVLPSCDVLLISGGASVGEHDHSRSAVQNNGVVEEFWKVAQKPGKPLSFGRGPMGQLVFVLPGNPASVFVGAMVHVRSALHQLQGRPPPHCVQAILSAPMESDQRRERLVRVSAQLKNTVLTVKPLSGQASHMTTNLAQTQAIARIPPGRNLPAGSLVSVWLFGDAADF